MNNNLSENLKKIRKDNNISQEQLAEELGVSRQAVSKWESGVAYPEMEKIIQLAEKFDLNIDDLLHKDIREVKKEETSKKDINKFIDSFLSYITDTVNLFSSMTFKSKIKCILEQAFIALVLLMIILIIGSIGSGILQNIFGLLPYTIYSIISSIIDALYLLIALIISIMVILHIFKIRYLDYYKSIKKEPEEKDNNKEEKDTNKKVEKKENKIVIRDPKHSEYKFINGIFKIIILGIKALALFILVFLCMGLVGIFTGIVISFCICKTGLFFLGVLLSALSAGVIDIVLILLLLNFIFTRKNDKKKMIWSFIISVVTLGIGLGMITLGTTSFNVKEYNENVLKNETLKIEMKDNLFIHRSTDYELIEKDIDNIEIEYKVNKACNGEYFISEIDGVTLSSTCDNPMELIRQFISNANKKEISTLNADLYSVKIYANKDNIKVLENNYSNYLKKIEEENNTIDDLNNIIKELEEQLDNCKNKYPEEE